MKINKKKQISNILKKINIETCNVTNFFYN